MPRVRPKLTAKQIIWLYHRIVVPACKDLRTACPMPKVLMWVYLQGMYDAVQAMEPDDV